MCLESNDRMSRRRPIPLPVLSLQDSGSDTDTEPPRLLTLLPPRNSHPEIFTFDVESVNSAPVNPLHRRRPSGAKGRRSRRVLYPAKVRRYLPPAETDRPLRWLYLLCLLVFVQICCEDAVPEELALPTAGGLHGLQLSALLPTAPGPAIPFCNVSYQVPVNDITLSWLYHQR
ncbi:radiation-inducible immediate-early gene IEX-1 [Bufo bufo]|uniref:radiation-inducible immediate-early gene IEX-1 n=1 Tax=Bufo bufo TaxID=8384 RepID=UPI001ABE33FE|nr:radiation-inducible immediate-early gene IEX-1 [Bufo bufo]